MFLRVKKMSWEISFILFRGTWRQLKKRKMIKMHSKNFRIRCSRTPTSSTIKLWFQIWQTLSITPWRKWDNRRRSRKRNKGIKRKRNKEIKRKRNRTSQERRNRRIKMRRNREIKMEMGINRKRNKEIKRRRSRSKRKDPYSIEWGGK